MVLKMKAKISNTCFLAPHDGDSGAQWVNNRKMLVQVENYDWIGSHAHGITGLI